MITNNNSDETQKKRLIEQIKEAKLALAEIEGKCYSIFNESVGIDFLKYNEYVKLKKEEGEILKKFGKESGDVAELYEEYVKRAKAKLLKKKRELRIVQNRVLKKKSILNVLKGQILHLKEFLYEFKNEVLQFLKTFNGFHMNLRRIFIEMIEGKNNNANSVLVPLSKQLLSLEKEISEIRAGETSRITKVKQTCEIATNEVFHYEKFDEKLIKSTQEIAKSLITVFSTYYQKISVDHLNQKLDIIEGKTNDISRKIKILNVSNAEKRSAIVSHNFCNLVYSYYKSKNFESALDVSITDNKNELILMSPQLEEERRIANQVVGKTNMTVNHIRKEINRIYKEISLETISFTEQLKALDSKEQEFSNKAMPIIENLEIAESKKAPIPKMKSNY